MDENTTTQHPRNTGTRRSHFGVETWPAPTLKTSLETFDYDMPLDMTFQDKTSTCATWEVPIVPITTRKLCGKWSLTTGALKHSCQSKSASVYKSDLATFHENVRNRAPRNLGTIWSGSVGQKTLSINVPCKSMQCQETYQIKKLNVTSSYYDLLSSAVSKGLKALTVATSMATIPRWNASCRHHWQGIRLISAIGPRNNILWF